MEQGMLWYDNQTGMNLDERIKNAIVYFTQKYGQQPEQCFVNPEMVSGNNTIDLPVKVVADEKVLRNHIWIEFPHGE